MKQNYIEVFVNKEDNITLCYGKSGGNKQSIELDMISIDPRDVRAIAASLVETLDGMDSKNG